MDIEESYLLGSNACNPLDVCYVPPKYLSTCTRLYYVTSLYNHRCENLKSEWNGTTCKLLFLLFSIVEPIENTNRYYEFTSYSCQYAQQPELLQQCAYTSDRVHVILTFHYISKFTL
jgi:hypothetical protein